MTAFETHRARTGRIAGLIALLLIGVMVLDGCARIRGITNPQKRMVFDGVPFKARAARSKEDRAVFLVTVRGATQTLKGARLAGAHEGTRYCITEFGTSNIEWIAGPDAPDSALRLVDDRLELQGRCRP